MDSSDRGSLSRRACVRLVIWGAAGLSLLPGCLRGKGGGPLTTCYAPPPPPGRGGATDASLLGKYARLGQVWREMSSHRKRPRGSMEDGSPSFNALKEEMQEALDAANAWPELRLAFEERWDHIHRSQYSGMTCYAPMAPDTPRPRVKVEEQVEELEKLVADGTLTKEAAEKAAEALAFQAEYYVQAQKATSDTEALGKLRDEYNDGTLEVGEPAALAGQRLAEFTIDDIGYVAGPPQETEKAGVTEASAVGCHWAIAAALASGASGRGRCGRRGEGCEVGAPGPRLAQDGWPLAQGVRARRR